MRFIRLQTLLTTPQVKVMGLTIVFTTSRIGSLVFNCMSITVILFAADMFEAGRPATNWEFEITFPSGFLVTATMSTSTQRLCWEDIVTALGHGRVRVVVDSHVDNLCRLHFHYLHGRRLHNWVHWLLLHHGLTRLHHGLHGWLHHRLLLVLRI